LPADCRRRRAPPGMRRLDEAQKRPFHSFTRFASRTFTVTALREIRLSQIRRVRAPA
jgi:hypothetical protein